MDSEESDRGTDLTVWEDVELEVVFGSPSISLSRGGFVREPLVGSDAALVAIRVDVDDDDDDDAVPATRLVRPGSFRKAVDSSGTAFRRAC